MRNHIYTEFANCKLLFLIFKNSSVKISLLTTTFFYLILQFEKVLPFCINLEQESQINNSIFLVYFPRRINFPKSNQMISKNLKKIFFPNIQLSSFHIPTTNCKRLTQKDFGQISTNNTKSVI